MCEKYITANYIQKLGHKIQEIRERALFYILSKLDNGYKFDNDLARSRELLSHLFRWFLFEPCTNEEHVLKIIKRVFESDAGQLLVAHLGKAAIQLELDKIRTYINPKYIHSLDEVQQLLNKADKKLEISIPPLKSDIPLSYRSIYEEKVTSVVGTTATTIEGFIQESSSLAQQIGLEKAVSRSEGSQVESQTYRIKTINEKGNVPYSNLYVVLKWQPLIETDRNVLQSVKQSLGNPEDISALFHSCEFFKNVLLHDFPAEIFIQRPGLIMIFFDFLQTCRSTRLTNILLICLHNLTRELQKRINYYNDPCMRNLKTDILSNLTSTSNEISLNRSSGKSDRSINENEYFEESQETTVLQSNQMYIPYYCFQTMNVVLRCLTLNKENIRECKLNLNQIGINTVLRLLNELQNLLCQAVGDSLWNIDPNPESLRIFKELNNTLSIYGDTLEFFRVESLSLETDTKYRVIYLYLLSICAQWLNQYIPLSKSKIILPKNFKISISNSLLDVSLGRLFPKIHKCLLGYVEAFSISEDKEGLKRYQDVITVCDGLTATIKFQRNAGDLTITECIRLIEKGLPSLQFHKSDQFLESVIDIFSEKLYTYNKQHELVTSAQDIVVKLLAHRNPDTQKKMYQLCHKKVIDNIGTKINISSSKTTGSRVFFLFSSDILTEIAVFGLNNEDIKDYAEDILIYILKCKIIISEDLWMKCLEALVPTLPFLLCYADNYSALGRLVANLIDPDTSKSLSFPDIVMLKCNIQLLYTRDPDLRNEAYSRLCWLIASQENSRDTLPKFNTIYDKGLSSVCSIKNVIDINKIRRSEHFYQPSSLHQVLDLLKSSNVEPVIRRSALNQVSVMMEDHLLHDVFLESNGIGLMLDIMKTCLKEKDFRDYPDSIIPVISILKCISLYHSSVRQCLSTNIDVLYYTLRGIFLFFTDDRVRQDGSILLFLFIFKDNVIGSPSRANFSVPFLINEHLLLPFRCIFYMTVSQHLGKDLYSTIVEDKWSLSSIQVQWNADQQGGFHNLIELDNMDLLSELKYTNQDILKLSNCDLNNVKSSSIHFSIKKYLHTIQNATSHDIVIESISLLILYLNFYVNVNHFAEAKDHHELLAHPWEKSFTRFLEVLPSTEEDIHLLKSVIRILIFLIPFYKDEVFLENCWISDFIKNPKHCLLDLLSYDYTTDEETKNLSQELLELITLCVVQEQHYLDHYTLGYNKTKSNIGWNPLIKIITDNLLFNNTQHFYNLAYLDALLSCLVHLTASLGWTNSTANSAPKEPLPQMISSLCELLTAFHCGKGPTAAISVMGLRISRNVLLILNHILAEIQNSKNKKWETCFFDDIDTNFTRSILALWASRDVVLRAAALQLFSNLAISPKAAQNIMNDLKFDNGNIWELTFTVLIDHTEASIVRENATLLLTNLSKNILTISDSKPSVLLSVSSSNIEAQGPKDEILSLLEEYDFYNHLDIILSSLFTLNYSLGINSQDANNFKYSNLKRSSSDTKSKESDINITTPGLINAICAFLYNIVELAPMEICFNLHDRGLVKLIFRTLCNPTMTVNDNRELALYCNILEMNKSVCSILRKICSLSPLCVGTVLYTRDCLFAMFVLLNSKLYHTNLSELLYLRNSLWSEIFNLSTVLLEHFNDGNKISTKSIEAINVIMDTIIAVGVETFLDSLCESLSCLGTSDLQHSALQFIISLLRIEIYNVFEYSGSQLREYSLKMILNTVRTPRTVMMSSIKDNVENIEPVSKIPNLTKKSLKQFDKCKRNILEEVYFGKIIQSSRDEDIDEIEVSFVDNDDNTLPAGAELCKILLYLYEIASIKLNKNQQYAKEKSMIVLALASLVGLSEEAKTYALKKGLMEVIIKELRDHHIKLSLESVESLKKIQDKKRLCPILKDTDELIGLVTNFMLNSEKVKLVAVNLSLADVIHKLWIWVLIQNIYVVNVLRLFVIYTKDCTEACRSLSLTSAVPGSGPRKTPSNVSLLHAIITVITKEMDQISRSHNLTTLILAFDILQNCTNLLECRVLISKSNLFQVITKLHPAVTKRQFPWDSIELLWLKFLQSFTRYPEGQTQVAKVSDVLDLIILLTSSIKVNNREAAILVLRNVAFYQPNRPRLLSSGEFMSILQNKLVTGTIKEKKTVILIMWSLAANNQKAKLVFKSAKLDVKLENILKHSELLGNSGGSFEPEDLNIIQIVLNILRGSDKIK